MCRAALAFAGEDCAEVLRVAVALAGASSPP